ncbi:MAG: PAS domain S-box protein, partial [Chloroflexi bacterium]|nr:PAS domain S-box protein [Chloroflexota bacterium]
LTLATLAGIELLRHQVDSIEHPAALLQTAVMFSAFLGGLRSGIVSAALVALYGLWFYALPGSLLTYTTGNGFRLLSLLLQAPLAAALVGWLHLHLTQSERRFTESDTRLAGVTHAILDGIVIIDERGLVEFINPAAARIFGYVAEEVTGRSVSLLMPEPYRREHDGYIERYRKTGIPHILGVDREVVARRKDGTDFPMELAVSELQSGERRLFVGVLRDISERKQTELQIQFQRTLLECQSEAAPDGVLVVSNERQWLHVNRRFLDMWGISPEAAAAKSSAAAIQAVTSQVADPEQFVARLQQLYRDGDAESEETVLLKDGRVFERYSAPVKAGDGLHFGRVWYYRDVTAAKRAEAAVRESEARYRLLADNSSDLITRHAPNGAMLYVSQASQKLLGYAPEELIGMRPRFYLHPDDVALLRAASTTTPLGQPFTVTYRMLHKDGHYVWVEVTSRAVVDPATGTADEYVAVTRDVTERRMADERLQQTMVQLEEQYRQAERARGEVRAVLDAAGEAIVLIAPDRRVLWINRVFAEFFGVNPERAVGRPLSALGGFSERMFPDAQGLANRFTRTLQDQTVVFREIITQRTPQARELELYSTPVHAGDGEHLGRLFVFRDVTREREVDRMKSEFVSLVLHELRTPLTSIKGYVDLLIDGEVGEVTDDQHEFLSIVKNNADRLVSLINDLLDISRIESGRIELNLSNVDLVRLIESVTTTLRPQVDAREQHLTVAMQEGLPLVRGDADRISQILFNLISNAYKYTPHGGAITVAAALE